MNNEKKIRRYEKIKEYEKETKNVIMQINSTILNEEMKLRFRKLLENKCGFPISEEMLNQTIDHLGDQWHQFVSAEKSMRECDDVLKTIKDLEEQTTRDAVFLKKLQKIVSKLPKCIQNYIFNTPIYKRAVEDTDYALDMIPCLRDLHELNRKMHSDTVQFSKDIRKSLGELVGRDVLL
jgi:hypothetical protein